MYLPQVCIQSYVPILNIDSSNDYIYFRFWCLPGLFTTDLLCVRMGPATVNFLAIFAIKLIIAIFVHIATIFSGGLV